MMPLEWSIRAFDSASIYLNGCSRDIAGQRACEKSDERRQFFRFADTAERYLFDT